jgi:arginyl-tRNA--protein-N-Asp/Glu arginylyltransferase
MHTHHPCIQSHTTSQLTKTNSSQEVYWHSRTCNLHYNIALQQAIPMIEVATLSGHLTILYINCDPALRLPQRVTSVRLHTFITHFNVKKPNKRSVTQFDDAQHARAQTAEVRGDATGRFRAAYTTYYHSTN